jgi:hypothetical protein
MTKGTRTVPATDQTPNGWITSAPGWSDAKGVPLKSTLASALLRVYPPDATTVGTSGTLACVAIARASATRLRT